MDIAKAMQDRADEMTRNLIYGTATVKAAPAEPLTLDTLRKMMLKMPAKETWLSSCLFPFDKAFVVKAPGETFTCAHPGFFTRLRYEAARLPGIVTRPAGNQPLFGMSLDAIEIDPCEVDDEATALWRADHWDRLREAVEVAMIPLPEWLRAPPKCGKHG